MDKGKNKENESSISGGIKWFLILAVVFAITYFLAPSIIREMRTVEYQNITFTKTHFGSIPVYYYWYNLEGKNGAINRYNLYLREDPRKSQVEVIGSIDYPAMGKNIYASINESSFKECPNANREITTLGMFIVGNQFNFEMAYIDNKTATERGGKFVNCQNAPRNMVIEIEMTNRTVIEKISNTCYKIEYKDCDDFLDVIEKWEVQSVVEAKNRQYSNNSIYK